MRFRSEARVVGVLVLVLAAGVLGCGGEKEDDSAGSAGDAVSNQVAESLIEHAAKQDGQDVDVDIQGSGDAMSITVQGEQGGYTMTSGAGSEPPKDMPQDVPVYPGLNVQFTHAVSEQQLFNVSGDTTAAASEVLAFYKKEAAAKGWTEQTSSQTNTEGQQMHLLMYQKENRMMQVVIQSEGEKTTVTVNTALQ